MTKEEQLAKAKDLSLHQNAIAQGGKDPYEDTVSEADLDSSDDEEDVASNAGKEKAKRGDEKPGTPGSSKYSHSRFSSNAGLSELEIDMAVMQAEQN